MAHLPFSLFVDVNCQIKSEEVINFVNEIPNIDLLIMIDAPDDILLSRVVDRGKEGHRRIDFNSEENIQIFMNQSREVLNVLKQSVKHEIYKNIEETIDEEKIIKMIGLNDV